MFYKLSGYLHSSDHPNHGGIHDNERKLMEEIAKTRPVSLTATYIRKDIKECDRVIGYSML
jgi:hypothetical protein